MHLECNRIPIIWLKVSLYLKSNYQQKQTSQIYLSNLNSNILDCHRYTYNLWILNCSCLKLFHHSTSLKYLQQLFQLGTNDHNLDPWCRLQVLHYLQSIFFVQLDQLGELPCLIHLRRYKLQILGDLPDHQPNLNFAFRWYHWMCVDIVNQLFFHLFGILLFLQQNFILTYPRSLNQHIWRFQGKQW